MPILRTPNEAHRGYLARPADGVRRGEPTSVGRTNCGDI
jgi:hypothetical protein